MVQLPVLLLRLEISLPNDLAELENENENSRAYDAYHGAQNHREIASEIGIEIEIATETEIVIVIVIVAADLVFADRSASGLPGNNDASGEDGSQKNQNQNQSQQQSLGGGAALADGLVLVLIGIGIGIGWTWGRG